MPMQFKEHERAARISERKMEITTAGKSLSEYNSIRYCLLVFKGLIAIVALYLAITCVSIAVQERRIESKLRAQGAIVQFENQIADLLPQWGQGWAWVFRRISIINCRGNILSPESLTEIGGIASLECLDLSSTPITDADLVHLGCTNRLTCLNLSRTNVTDRGMRYLRHLRGLKQLLLEDTAISDIGMTDFKGLLCLESVDLDYTLVTDEGLRQCAGLSRLERLDLEGTHVRGYGLRNLGMCRRLETLILNRTDITDEGLEECTRLTQLKVLGLENTQVSDSGISRLHCLSGLRGLYIIGTSTSYDGRIAFCLAVPSCEIMSPTQIQEDLGKEEGGGDQET